MHLVVMPQPRGGSSTHLYYIEKDTSSEVLMTLYSILVVRDFSDVFGEILGFPLIRVFDFVIDLISGHVTY